MLRGGKHFVSWCRQRDKPNHKPPRKMILPILLITFVALVITGIIFTDPEVDFSDIPQRPSRRK